MRGRGLHIESEADDPTRVRFVSLVALMRRCFSVEVWRVFDAMDEETGRCAQAAVRLMVWDFSSAAAAVL
jgi:hypothetical protein